MRRYLKLGLEVPEEPTVSGLESMQFRVREALQIA